ncbi:UDP binding domain-containing protein [Streptomyces sp. GESEQ-35]|uniref:UDP binding domain-containing protein n=1 Tax=Streptomyces sp. GESEQ-35 TaxID=2812657 RepID=UPI0035AC1440
MPRPQLKLHPAQKHPSFSEDKDTPTALHPTPPSGLQVTNRRDANALPRGAPFKPNTDDIRDSPALAVAQKLHERGATVTVATPWPSTTPARRTQNSTSSTTQSPPFRTPTCCCT